MVQHLIPCTVGIYSPCSFLRDLVSRPLSYHDWISQCVWSLTDGWGVVSLCTCTAHYIQYGLYMYRPVIEGGCDSGEGESSDGYTCKTLIAQLNYCRCRIIIDILDLSLLHKMQLKKLFFIHTPFSMSSSSWSVFSLWPYTPVMVRQSVSAGTSCRFKLLEDECYHSYYILSVTVDWYQCSVSPYSGRFPYYRFHWFWGL